MTNSFFIDPSGSVVEVAPDQAANFAQAKGYVPASPKQIEDFQIQQKYGTPIEGAKALVEHAASALTFGLSDVAERAAGVSPEAMAGREQANPLLSAGGTAGGIAIPLVASLGAAGPAEGLAGAGRAAAKLTAPSLISRAGEAVGELAPKALGKVGGKALQYGAEGALYGAGNVVHEAALGDPNLTAQSALASIGMSGLLGGALGAGSGALSELGGKLTDGEMGSKVRSLLDHAEDVSTLNATNAMPSEVRKVLENKGAGIGKEAGKLGILQSWSDGPETILSRSQGVIDEAGQALGRLTEAADVSGKAPTWTFPEIVGDAQAKIGTALRREGSTIAIADQVDSVFNRFAEAYGDRELGVADVHALRRDLDNEIYKFGRSLDPFQKPTGKPLMRFRAHLTQEIEDGLKAGGQSLPEWKAANRAVEVGETMKMLAESGTNRNAVNNPLHLSGMMGASAGLIHGGPAGAAAVGLLSEGFRRRGAATTAVLARGLSRLIEGGALEGAVNHTAEGIVAERLAGAGDSIAQTATAAPESKAAIGLLAKTNEAVSTKIDRHIAAIAQGAPKVARGEVSAGIAHVFGEDAKTAAASYQKKASHLRLLAGDPEKMSGALQAQGEDLHEHAPQTAQAMAVTSARAVSFLASKLPPVIQPGPLEEPLPPTKTQIATFHRYQEAVQNPLGVLRQAQAGTLTPEAIEALQTVYPALYAKIQGQIVGHLAKGKTIPYRQKLMFSMLMGKDLDGTLSGMAIARNQALFAMQRPMAPAQGMKGLGKMTLPDRAQTSSQRASSAREK